MNAGPSGPVTSPLSSAGWPRRVVLTGFMGAGKSTVGRILAARLHWPFLDIDSLITTEYGRTVAQLFTEHGEEHFRNLEAEAIARVLDPAQEYKQAIVALGGGAIESPSVRKLLFPKPAAIDSAALSMVTVYLAAPLDELLARCHAGPASATDASAPRDAAPVRPLLTAPEPPDERLARRLPHYRRAHLTVNTGGVPAVEVVERILAWLSAPPPASAAG